ncbi:MAG: bifunctional DNA primase/polymerase [Planctomycetes bacterium]|nr:bifunctional DNA primase/polymerase [Planctomycetota bacterium]
MSIEKGAVAAAPEPEDRGDLHESMASVPRSPLAGNRMLVAALAYAARGWHVFPVFGDANDPRDKSPVGKKCKAPIGALVRHGLNDATVDPDVIRRWWTAEPGANIGVACGPSGLCIGDVDSAAGELAVKHSGGFPKTLEARTGKGRHVYMRGAATSVNGVLDGVDRKSKGGYVVAPPSVHESGRVYEWSTPDAAIAEAPDWFLKAGRKQKTKSAKANVDTSSESIEEGSRNDFLSRKAFAMRKAGIAPEDLVRPLMELNQKCKPPLDQQEVEAIARGKANVEPGEKVSKQADMLVRLAADIELFHDREGTAYASFMRDIVRETRRLRSKAFKAWLTWRAHTEGMTVPNSSAMNDALGALEGRALYEGPELPVFNRVARVGNRVYLDIGDENWSVIVVETDGWRLCANPPVRFIRGGNSRPLRMPVKGGGVTELRALLNVADDRSFAFIVAWMVFALAGQGPFPVLNLNGPQGSAKTTAAECIRLLIDPAKALVRSLPRSVDDLLTAATHSLVLSLDNVSKMPVWLSDEICRIATGSGSAKRALYTDDDEHVSEVCRPVLLNGIGQYVNRGDLVDRLLDVALVKIDERSFKPKAVLDATFKLAAPRILGALLDAVSCGLKHLDATQVQAPRMADFARFIEAASPALGWKPGWFLDQYATAREEQRADLLDNSELGKAVVALVPFRGTASELRNLLVKPWDERKPQPSWMPKSATLLSTELDRLLPLLASAGVSLRRPPRTGKKRILELAQRDCPREPASPASRASQPASGMASTGDAASDANKRNASPRDQAARSPSDAGDASDAAKPPKSLPDFNLTPEQYWGKPRKEASDPP